MGPFSCPMGQLPHTAYPPYLLSQTKGDKLCPLSSHTAQHNTRKDTITLLSCHVTQHTSLSCHTPPTDHLPTTYRPRTDHVFTVQLVHDYLLTVLHVLHVVSDPDREREVLEKTEQAFQTYAKQLKSDVTSNKVEKRPSLVSLHKMNFEDPRVVKEPKDQSKPTSKRQDLLHEKAELTAKLDTLKRRVTIAKDRKVFFGLSNGKNTAVSAADTELQNAQAELAKAKERLNAIESETKNLKVLELRYQKTTDNTPAKKPPPLVRRNSREVKIGVVDKPAPKVDSTNFNPEGPKAQKGSVLQQIKVRFERRIVLQIVSVRGLEHERCQFFRNRFSDKY